MSNEIILCVDDDTSVLYALRSLLINQFGKELSVEIAESGAEALEIVEDLKINDQELSVIISDFIMPEMRGDDLLTQVHLLSPKTITILLTGQSDFAGVKKAINEANLYRFLEKPFNNEDILLTIKSARCAFQQERELSRQNSELSTLNSELEKMLSRINSQQEQLARSEAKSTISMLVASVSHELGTPLSNCVMSASTLIDLGNDFKDKLDSGQLQRQDLDDFIDLLSQMSSLLQRNLQRACDLMQNFKQVAADQASEQRRQFDLATMLKEILATMAPGLRNKPHRIALEIPENIFLDSYPGAIGQVVINLVNNAYLHAFEGKTNGLLTIRARLENNLLYLSFEDNGVGISAENLIQIRSPFFSTKIGRGGTGLGMSIVDNLISKTLQGSMTISSTVGEGSLFTICLPLILSEESETLALEE